MWRELRVTLALIAVVLIVGAPLIFAGPGPANTNYLALVLHLVPPTPIPPTATPTRAPTLTPSPTRTPIPTLTPTVIPTVHVRSYRTFTVSTGSLYVVGEVENSTSKVAYFVQVIGRFYDASNALVATDSTYTFLTKTSPGQRNPFKLILSNAPAGITRIDLSVTSSSSSILNYQAATILSQLTRDNFGLEVFGELQNPHARELRSIELAVTFYDAVGNVYDADFGFPDISPLAPGAISTYKVSTFEDNLAGLAFIVQAQGYLAP